MACLIVKGVSCMFGKHKVTLIAIHLYPIYFCAKLYSCTPYKQPKGREYNVISLLELYYLDCFFLMMGQSKNK